MRRLALALCGTIPSLEEIRRFEATPKQGRLEAWLDSLLSDRRCSDYLAERFARTYVGVEDGPFVLYRRRRLISWLSDALLQNRRYDLVVRDLIADTGLWTDHPATNFVSVTFDPDLGRPTPERLAARSRGPSSACGSIALSATTIRFKNGSRRISEVLHRSSAGSDPICAERMTPKTTTGRPIRRPRNLSRSRRASRFTQTSCRPQAARAISLRPGSSTRRTNIFPARRLTAFGRSCSAARSSSQLTI